MKLKVIHRYSYLSHNKSTNKHTKGVDKKICKIRHKIEMSKSDFFNERRNNLPSYEDRYIEILGDMRYGKTACNILFAEMLAKQEDLYLKHVWAKNPISKKLNLDLALKRMYPEKLLLYDKSKKVLKEKHLSYDLFDLANFDNKILMALSKGNFVEGSHVLMHGYAYYISSALRAGLNVNDTVLSILKEGFRTLKPLKQSKISYRKICGNKEDKSIDFIWQLINLKKGDIFTDRGFMYSTPDKSAVLSGGNRDAGTPEITMQILIPENARVSYINKKGQSEILFPNGADFEVIDEAKIVESGKWFKNKYGETTYSGDNIEMKIKYIIPD